MDRNERNEVSQDFKRFEDSARERWRSHKIDSDTSSFREQRLLNSIHASQRIGHNTYDEP